MEVDIDSPVLVQMKLTLDILNTDEARARECGERCGVEVSASVFWGSETRLVVCGTPDKVEKWREEFGR